jgi:hypothetical protein
MDIQSDLVWFYWGIQLHQWYCMTKYSGENVTAKQIKEKATVLGQEVWFCHPNIQSIISGQDADSVYRALNNTQSDFLTHSGSCQAATLFVFGRWLSQMSILTQSEILPKDTTIWEAIADHKYSLSRFSLVLHEIGKDDTSTG